MKPRIFITGGSGLLAVNWAVTARDTFDVTLGLHERKINLQGVQSIPVDLDSVVALERVLGDLQPNWVIHTAGLTSVEECELNPELARHINVNLAQNMAFACAKLKLPLVHISTDHVFRGDQSLVDENCLVDPVNVYGKTKAEAELRVLEANPEALVIRTNFYGWGTTYRQSFGNFMIEALRTNQRIRLFQDVYYTPILAEVLVQVSHELIKRCANGIFNVSGDDRVSKYDFGLMLAKQFNLDSRLIDVDWIANHPHLVRRPYDMSLNNQKVSNFLGCVVGGLENHFLILKQQEVNGHAQELQKL